MIRLPEVPGLAGTQINAAPVNPGAAAAPAVALGTLAKGIASIAEPFAKIANQVQDNEDLYQLSTIRNTLDQRRADKILELDKEVDPAERLKQMDSFLGEQQEWINSQELSPEAKAKVGLYYDEWATKTRISHAANTADYSRTRADLAFKNEIEEGFRNRDLPRLKQAYDDAIRAGVRTPEAWPEIQRKFDDQIKEDQVIREIDADPAGWLERNQTMPANELPAEWDAKRSRARQRLNQETADTVDQVQDLIAAGKIKDIAQLEQAAGNLRPAALDALKAGFAKRIDAADQARRATPEYQNEVIGQATAMMADLNPNLDNYDANYVKIDNLIRSLPEGTAARAELTRNLSDIRQGVAHNRDSNIKIAEDQLLEAYKTGRFGAWDTDGKQGKARMTLGAALDDGLLQDTGKLEAYGFSEDQAKDISKQPDHSKRMAMFRELYDKRAGTPGRVSDFDQALFQAVRDRKELSAQIEADDPELQSNLAQQKLDAQRKLGAARKELLDFAKANPQATREQIEDQIYKLAGKEARDAARRSMLTPRPGAGGAADPGANIPAGDIPRTDLKSMIKYMEAGAAPGGFHANAYWDHGQWSIGYGTRSKPGETITKAEAEARLDKELAMHKARVERAAEKYGLKFSPHEIDALTSFDFNTGWLDQLLAKGTRSKAEILAAMPLYRNARDSDGNFQRLRGLERRRAAEVQLFLHGYQQ